MTLMSAAVFILFYILFHRTGAARTHRKSMRSSRVAAKPDRKNKDHQNNTHRDYIARTIDGGNALYHNI